MSRKQIFKDHYAVLQKQWVGELSHLLTPANPNIAQQIYAGLRARKLVENAWHGARFENVTQGIHVWMGATGVVALAGAITDIVLSGGVLTTAALLKYMLGLGLTGHALKENATAQPRNARHTRDAELRLARAATRLEKDMIEVNAEKLLRALPKSMPYGIPKYNYFEFQEVSRPVLRHAFAGQNLSPDALEKKMDEFLRECFHEAVYVYSRPKKISGALIAAIGLGGGLAGFFKESGPEKVHAVLGTLFAASSLYAAANAFYYRRIENRQFDQNAEGKPVRPEARGHRNILCVADEIMRNKLAVHEAGKRGMESFVRTLGLEPVPA